MEERVKAKALAASGVSILTLIAAFQTRADEWQPPVLDGSVWGPRGLGKISYRFERTLSDHDMRDRLRDWLVSPLLATRPDKATDTPRTTPENSSEIWRFYHRNIVICGYSVRLSHIANGRQLALGGIPVIDPQVAPPPLEWPDPTRSAASVSRAWALTNGAAKSWQKTDATRCYTIHQGQLLPAWKLHFDVNGLPYEAIADDHQVYSMSSRYFRADGLARAYLWNDVVSPTLSDLPLTQLIGDGSLSDHKLQLANSDGYTKAYSPDHNFIYDVSDERFAQASAFAHAQQHRLWLERQGAPWVGDKPLQIKLHARLGGSVNNAIYLPGDDTHAATIALGDGDGIELKNLSLDADVVGHELGHHIVFQTLKKTDGESLLIHEALADFLQYAHAGNPCLGESICPIGSDACVLEAQCLRSGTINLVYEDATWNSWSLSRKHLGHRHSQVLSAMLWDLVVREQINLNDLVKLVLRAIRLLGEDSGIADFLASLQAADTELFDGTHITQLRAAVAARGLEEYWTDDSSIPNDARISSPTATAIEQPPSIISTATDTATASNSPSSEETTKQSGVKSTRSSACGVTQPRGSHTKTSDLYGLIFLLLPLIFRSQRVGTPIDAKKR